MLKNLLQRLSDGEIDVDQAASELASSLRSQPDGAQAALATLKVARGAAQISGVTYHRLCSVVRAATDPGMAPPAPAAHHGLDEPEETMLAAPAATPGADAEDATVLAPGPASPAADTGGAEQGATASGHGDDDGTPEADSDDEEAPTLLARMARQRHQTATADDAPARDDAPASPNEPNPPRPPPVYAPTAAPPASTAGNTEEDDDEAPTRLARMAHQRDQTAAEYAPPAKDAQTAASDAAPAASTPSSPPADAEDDEDDDEAPTIMARIARSRMGSRADAEAPSSATQAAHAEADPAPPPQPHASGSAAADDDDDGDEPPTVMARIARGRHGAGADERDRFRAPWERDGERRSGGEAVSARGPADPATSAGQPENSGPSQRPAADAGDDAAAPDPEATVVAPQGRSPEAGPAASSPEPVAGSDGAAPNGDNAEETVIARSPAGAHRAGSDPDDGGEQTVIAGPATGGQSQPPTGGGTDRGTSPRSDGSTGGPSTSPSQRSWTPPGGESTPELQGLGPGSVIKDRFVLEKVLGSGGMGKVYLASDQLKVEARDRNPHVALKVLTEDFKEHPEAFIALQREASRQQRLAHPNIATVYDFDRIGRSGTQVFITMEFMDGSPLNTFIKKEVRPRRGLPPEQAIPMIGQLGAALAYAHQRDIVHSDFKPGNAFLCNDGAMKVLDFGIARAVKAPSTTESESGEDEDDNEAEHTYFDAGQLGALTPAYASLEMLEGEVPDPRDDIYALACVAYELLTGYHPFARKSAAKAKAEGLTPAPIKSLKRRQMRGLMRGLTFDREHRTPDVETFVEEIEGRLNWHKNPYVIGGALAAALALASVGPVLNWVEQQRIQQLISDVRTGSAERIEDILADFGELETSTRTTITEEARPAFQTHFEHLIRQAVNPAAGRYEFAEAERELARARELYPDSAAMNELEQFLDTARDRRLNDLNRQFMAALEADRLLEEEGGSGAPTVPRILAQVEAIDPEHALLDDPRVPDAYASAAQGAINQGDVSGAQPYLDIGDRLAPDDAGLMNTRARYEAAVDDQGRLARVEELRAMFNDSELDTSERLERFREASGRIAELAWLAPTDPLLGALRESAQPTMAERVEALAAEGEADAARAFLDDYTEAMEALGLQPLLVQARQAAHPDTSDDAIRARIAAEAESGLATALADPAFDRGWEYDVRNHLRYLEAALTDEQENAADRLTSARADLASAYTERADALEADQRYSEAVALLDRARTLDLERPVIDERYASMRAAQREFQRERDDAARQARIQGLKETMLIQARAGDLNSATDTYDEIESLVPVDDPFLAVTAPNALGAAFADSAAAQGEMGNHRASLRIAERGREYAPDHRRLNEAWQSYTVEVNILDLRHTFDRRDSFDTARVARKIDEIRLWAPGRYRQLEPEFISTLRERIRALAQEDRSRAQRLAARGSNVFPASASLAQMREELAPQPWPSASAARAALSAGRLNEAEAVIERGRDERPDHPEVQNLAENLAERKEDAESAFGSFRQALVADELADARRYLSDARSQWVDNRTFREAQSELSERVAERRRNRSQVLQRSQNIDQLQASAESTGTDVAGQDWEPVASNRPCTTALAGYGPRSRAICYDLIHERVRGPLMVVVPGAGPSEPFAVSKYEVSVEDYNKYCFLSGDCAVDENTASSRPRTGLSVAQVNQYADWLSQRTGHEYRLPRADEWDHAAGAAGEQPPRDFNCRVTLGDQVLKGTDLVDVTAGQQNGWGLKNYIGNAREIVLDDDKAVVRGGSYRTSHSECGLEREQPFAGQGDDVTGFRLIRADVPQPDD